MTTHTNKKPNWNCELSLQQLLGDPLVSAVMAADRVDARELHRKLSQKALSLRPGSHARAERPAAALACCCG